VPEFLEHAEGYPSFTPCASRRFRSVVAPHLGPGSTLACLSDSSGSSPTTFFVPCGILSFTPFRQLNGLTFPTVPRVLLNFPSFVDLVVPFAGSQQPCPFSGFSFLRFPQVFVSCPSPAPFRGTSTPVFSNAAFSGCSSPPVGVERVLFFLQGTPLRRPPFC